jgi:pimeloyl-ACP methyl ester carboxylesterase
MLPFHPHLLVVTYRKRDVMTRNFVSEDSANRLSRRSAVSRLAGASAAIAVAASALGASRGAAQAAASPLGSSTVAQKESIMTEATPTATAPLTVVLVHGAFADSSSWTGVIERLQAAGIPVTAAVNPLRGVNHDAAYVASRIEQIPGPVLVVGHSYGGTVISNAATNAKNVVGLVFVAALAPEEGEVLGTVEQGSKDSVLGTALVPLNYPTGQGDETVVEFVINPAQLREVFAADLPEKQTAVMAATQRPASELAFSEPSGPPAWKTLPSWAVVATGDKAAGTDVIRAQAERAKATITEVEGSHVIMISQPQAVADVIMTAVNAVS